MSINVVLGPRVLSSTSWLQRHYTGVRGYLDALSWEPATIWDHPSLATRATGWPCLAGTSRHCYRVHRPAILSAMSRSEKDGGSFTCGLGGRVVVRKAESPSERRDTSDCYHSFRYSAGCIDSQKVPLERDSVLKRLLHVLSAETTPWLPLVSTFPKLHIAINRVHDPQRGCDRHVQYSVPFPMMTAPLDHKLIIWKNQVHFCMQATRSVITRRGWDMLDHWSTSLGCASLLSRVLHGRQS